MCETGASCGCGCAAKTASKAKSSRTPARRERDVVLTDRQGRSFDRPRRKDFKTDGAYLDAYDDYRRRIMDAMSNRGMELGLERDAGSHTRRDPSLRPDPLIVGAIYHLEWDTHDEGDDGTYLYQGVYAPTGADMFRRVSPYPKRRVTLYLFPHEIRYLELLVSPRAVKPRSVPTPPASGTRRRAPPALSPGRVLTRSARTTSREWDQGIVGAAIVRAAQFQGFRNIDGRMLGVWSANGVLYAQPLQQPRRP